MNATCRYCESSNLEQRLTPDGPHYAAERCLNCGRHLRWIPKPDSEKARRPAAHRELVRKFGRGFCELCLLAENDLPGGQTLEGHHVVPFAAGGTDEQHNVQILCTGCHRFIHWRRTYATPRVSESAT